jgi:hypothetical protein
MAAQHVSHRPGDTQAATASPGCYARWMVQEVRAGIEPHMLREPPLKVVPNHSPTYDDFPTSSKHLGEIEARGVLSARTFSRPKRAAALLAVIREKNRRKAALTGDVPKGRCAIDLKSSDYNDCTQVWPFLYETVDNCVRVLPPPGAEVWVCKLDLVKYFLTLAAGPNMQQYLWFSDPRFEPKALWRGRGRPPASFGKCGARKGRWRHYTTCPFGVKILPAWANMLSGEICRYMRMLGCRRLSFLTDDFFIVAFSFAQCERFKRLGIELFKLLGLESSAAKAEGPARMLEFLGVEVGADGQLMISYDRLDIVMDKLLAILAGDAADRDHLRSLAGLMSWYALYIRGGRTFMRALWGMVNWDSERCTVPVTDEFRDNDASWWVENIKSRSLSGSRLFLGGISMPARTIKSDGSGSGRFGFVYRDDNGNGTIYYATLHAAANYHVPYVELAAVHTCVMMFAHTWGGLVINFGVDSAPICDALNTASSRDEHLIALLRDIARAQSTYHFDFLASHVARQYNKLADAATRALCPQEYMPFLADEGYNASDLGATLRRSRWCSPLQCGPLTELSLGQCRATR